jgi:homeobox-leucine zipper protein
MMKLSQKMVNNFCANLSASQMHRWTAISGVDNDSVLVTVHRSSEPGQPSGVVLSAATSIWLPVSCERVFNFLKDERSQVSTSFKIRIKCFSGLFSIYFYIFCMNI